MQQIELNTAALMGQYYICGLGQMLDPNYPEWQKKQLETALEGKAFSDKTHLFLLKNEYESKKAFLDQYKKSPVRCCIIQ